MMNIQRAYHSMCRLTARIKRQVRHRWRPSLSPLVECESIFGNTTLLPKDRLVFRPAVYAVIVHEGKILMVRTRSTGRYDLPGGGVELGERLEDALKREVREETGVEIEVERCLHFEESFFYYDPLDEAFHSLLFYFLCKPQTLQVVDDTRVRDAEAEKPCWIDLMGLKHDNLHVRVSKAIHLAQEQI